MTKDKPSKLKPYHRNKHRQLNFNLTVKIVRTYDALEATKEVFSLCSPGSKRRELATTALVALDDLRLELEKD